MKTNTLYDIDYQDILKINTQLAECQSLVELNLIISTSLLSLLSEYKSIFYIRLKGEDNTPKMLINNDCRILCECQSKDFSETIKKNLLNNLHVEAPASLLATQSFCFLGKSCQGCSINVNKKIDHTCYHCEVITIFDSSQPSIALFFFWVSSKAKLNCKQDIELLQLFRATLMKTINYIFNREECNILKQILNDMSGTDELLTVVNDDGKLIYKNLAFERTVGHKASIDLLTKLVKKTTKKFGLVECDNFFSMLGKRLYEVNSKEIQGKGKLILLRFSRVTDKIPHLNRKLKKAGLTNRELEIAMLIIQGISTHTLSDQLHISYHTIRNHIKHVYCKLGISTRSELLTWNGSK